MTDKDTNPMLDRIDRQSGMTVPDGYFEQFAAQMKASLPEQPWEKESVTDGPNIMPARSLWQRVRPYVYMAAMFAGIWLMMNVSTLIGTGGDVPASSTASSSPTIAQLMDEGESEFSDYAIETIDPVDLYDALYEDGFQPVNLSMN